MPAGSKWRGSMSPPWSTMNAQLTSREAGRSMIVSNLATPHARAYPGRQQPAWALRLALEQPHDPAIAVDLDQVAVAQTRGCARHAHDGGDADLAGDDRSVRLLGADVHDDRF